MTKHTRATAAVLTTIGLVAAGATVATADVTTPNPQTLKAVGPVSPEHGFPVWYEDSNGLRLEQCLDTTNPYCDPAFLMEEMPNGLEPISFPGNWPMESFYHQVGAVVDVPSGGLGYVAALEATFANEAVQEGDQVVFGRVRFDLDLPGAGTYKVTHPYGVDTFNVSEAEADGFRYVEDITPAPGNFALAMKSRINPFLVREGGIITDANGNKYIGDPAEETRVTGSPLGTNYFKVELLNADGTATVIGETDVFGLMGKVSTNSGVNAGKAILNDSAAGKFLDVFAGTDAGDVITVEGTGFEKTTLQSEAGRYSARIPLTGTDTPTTVKVTNESDVPAASKTITVTDEVVVSGAVYDTGTDLLTVTASSTDTTEPPVLTLDGLTGTDGTAVTVGAGGTAQVSLQAAPVNVKVTSTGGGADMAPVTMSGGAAAAPLPTTAVAVASSSQVDMGGAVTLDGSSSQNASTYAWAQTAGETVALTDADKAMASFTAPSTPGELTFTLTVTDAAGGTVTSAPLAVTVVDPNAEPPVTEEPPPPSTDPVADAITSLESAMVGESVTISAVDNPNNASLMWSEASGAVTIADPAAKSFTFKMPDVTQPLVFNLTVTGASADGITPGATATDSVTVTPKVDVLTVDSAQYRADKREWRISGTASISTVNQVSVYLQKTNGTRTLLGTSPVSAPIAPATVGDWGIRVRGGATSVAGDTLTVESSRGGELTGVTISRR
ncbi:MAG TPA: hypothetical protein VFQ19_15030 [Nocardioidaceae bacterium]|nr:hypothetical protein [Nocardioidaceae bacterium]